VEQSPFTAQVARFVVLGLGNTLLTGCVYILLAQVLPLTMAYSIAWSLGLAIVAVFSPRFVFKAGGTGPRAKVGVGFAYLVAFLAGLLVTSVLGALGVATNWIVLVSVGTSASISFLGSRFVVSRA
jgi:putative flippase GtrA